MPPGYGGGYGAPPPGMNAPPGLGMTASTVPSTLPYYC